ncbi:MAG: sensor domain-containing diguanylate cyclase [Spirochaetota bacterium]
MSRSLVVLFALTAFSAPSVSHAHQIELTADRAQNDLAGGVRYLIDEYGNLSASGADSRRDEFQPLVADSIQLPRTGALWLSLSLSNPTANESWIIENTSNVEVMDLFVQEDGSWRKTHRSGNAIPFEEKTVQSRRPAVRLSIPEGGARDVLLRVTDYQSASIQLRVGSEPGFWADYRNETLVLGVVFGFFAALIVYNAIIFCVNRNKTYLVYALYMFAFALNQAAQERLWSEFVQPGRPYGFFWFIVFGSATAALGLEFFRRFIDTRRKMPRVDALMRIVQIAFLPLAASAFVVSGPVSADILNVLSLGAMGLIVYALVVRIVERDMLALACLAGSALYLAGTATEILSALIPVAMTPFVLHAQLYGALAQVLFLGFALGGKTHRAQEEHERMEREFRSELERQVQDRTRELMTMARQLEEQATTDALTGLYNRHELHRRIMEYDTLLSRAADGGSAVTLTIAYVDIDNFKACNDALGHDVGDSLLKETATMLRENTRASDLVFRVGGDEFLIVMPETGCAEATPVIERIRARFAALAPPNSHTSVSIGIAATDTASYATADELVRAADIALLASKESGKNRISVA